MSATPSDWQLKCIKLNEKGAHLLQSGELSDCTFLVGSKTNQARIVSHKFICAMASPVFEAMFYGSMAEKIDPVISILDIEPDCFKDLLLYMYTDAITITSVQRARELYYAAKKYLLLQLKEQCLQYIQTNMNTKNACSAYEFSKFYEERELMTKAVQMIMDRTMDVIQDRSFCEVEFDTLLMVVSLNKLNIVSELDLFNAAKRYAEAQKAVLSEWKLSSMIEQAPCKSLKNIDPPILPKAVSEENKNDTSLKAVTTESLDEESTGASASPSEHNQDQDSKVNCAMRSVIEKIRFLSMTPEMFARGPARSEFLTEFEAYAIFMNMLTTWTDVPMPQGFSTSKALRKQ